MSIGKGLYWWCTFEEDITTKTRVEIFILVAKESNLTTIFENSHLSFFDFELENSLNSSN